MVLLEHVPMWLGFPSFSTLIPTAETLLIAAVGAIAFLLIGFPAGLVTGSMLAVTVGALLGRPMKIPLPLARVCFVITGTLLGAVVTPATLAGIATWPLSVALVVVSAALMLIATTFYLRFVHGFDQLSAFLGASPGAFAQAITLAADFNANMRGVAIVQTTRVLVVLVGLPGALALFGLAASAPPPARVAVDAGSLVELAVLVGVSTALALVMLWLRFPGGLLFGALAGSAILHGGDFVHVTLPWWLGSPAVVVLGALVGSRFANTTVAMIAEYFWAALGSATVAVAISAGFVMVVTHLLPLRTADVLIAFAPGAQDTMMVLALALHLDPVYVGAHHLARFLIVTFVVALTAPRLARRQGAPRALQRRKRPGAFED
jgi:membrane AbrB-like protein